VTTPRSSSRPGEKLIRMTFVHKKVEKEKIVEAFAEGLANNSPSYGGPPTRRRSFPGSRRFHGGDTVDISLSPDGTVSATHNGKLWARCAIRPWPGVLLIWFGEKPADGSLKKGCSDRMRRPRRAGTTSGCRRSRRSLPVLRDVPREG